MNAEWPLSFRWARANGLNKLTPWHFLHHDDGCFADAQFKRERTDLREVRTFARRQDRYDFAGFLVVEGVVTEQVVSFHPSFGSGPNSFMIRSEHADFWQFVRDVVIPDTKDWQSEADLTDLKQEP